MSPVKAICGMKYSALIHVSLLFAKEIGLKKSQFFRIFWSNSYIKVIEKT